MNNNVPMPQDTKLYEVVNGNIKEPKLSVLSIDGTGSNGAYNDLQNKQYLFTLFNQNNLELNLSFNDKNISCTRSSSYFSLNGFDTGFDFRFLNFTAPSVCFYPLIKAQDFGDNIPLTNIATNTYTLNNYLAYISNTVAVNDLVLLKNQTNNSENVVYRVTAISDGLITLYNDILDPISINSLLTQNQNYIFTRAYVSDSLGEYYYGLYNTGGYYWVSQTKGLQLPDAKYGISLNSEVNCNKILSSYFSSVTLQLNDIIAINVLTDGSGSVGGKTSGLYSITKIENGYIFLQPIYPSYIFIHQFTKVYYNLDTQNYNEIWFVNPSTTGNTNHLYSSLFFNFSIINLSGVTSPNYWAKQVGGKYDQILGFTLYDENQNNNYLKHTDTFSVAIKPPTWTENIVEGIQLNINYSTNMLSVVEQPVEI